MSDKVRLFKVSLPTYQDRMRDQFVELSDIHCPDCGKDGGIYEYDDDYYAGTKYICVECYFTFYMSFGTEENAAKIADIIKAKAGA